MLNDINLIPQTEVVEQKKTQAVKSSTIFSIVILSISLAVAACYFINLTNLEGKISQTNKEIESLRSNIKMMSEIEVSARNLDKKYSALETLFSKRSKYSLLLREINDRKPEDVSISSLDVKVGEISISGVSNSYISVADFVNNFLNVNFEGGNPDLKDIFTAVSLNSVSLEKSSNTVKFFILVSYQDGRLQKL